MEPISVMDGLEYLSQGFLLIGTEDRTIVRKVGSRIVLRNNQWHSTLKEADFLILFQDIKFIIYDPQQDGINDQKDEDYYRWREKYL